jgi:flagellar hook protein FlgE
MAYGIGLTGLNSTSQAIDVVSNNIANAQTVGYKTAQFVFADMYFKANDAQAKDRVGMGSQQQAIRRDQSYGTLTTSQNPLDLAITGPGMFMLAKNTQGSVPVESPSKFEYTRNGQFGTDSENRLVNESGLFVVGYPADARGGIIAGAKSTLTLDQTPLPSLPTENSKIELNLDTSNLSLNAPFDSTNSSTYSQATSQTIYDQNGNGHILGLFYKRISSQPLTLNAVSNDTFSYNPTQTLGVWSAGTFTPKDNDATSNGALSNEQLPVIASTFGGENKKYVGAIDAKRYITDPALKNDRLINLTGARKVHTSGTPDTAGATYDLRLADGTHIPITQVKDGTDALGTAKYTASTDRFELYATIDGKPVGHNPLVDNDVLYQEIETGKPATSQAMSVGTMAFLGGHNIDTMAKGPDEKPVGADGLLASTVIELNALGVAGIGGYGETTPSSGQVGILQFTINLDKTTGLTSPAQTYSNSQDGHTVSNLASYSVDTSGKLVATYDNGVTHVKGQLILAQFGNVDGLQPNGSNTFAATASSGDPIFSAPGSGVLGQIRAKALESSNVDLSAQIVQLMVLQRQYSANSQALKLQAATTVDDVINMGR